jgi:hypothetical protein
VESIGRGTAHGAVHLDGSLALSRQAMTEPAQSGHLDELDGLNATRALILQAYYGLRRTSAPREIGTREIAAWIKRHEPEEVMPSDALIQLTLTQAKVPHRLPGRPRNNSGAPSVAPPFFLLRWPLPPSRPQR